MNGDSGRTNPLDMAAIRAKLEQARGPEYWRSLEELASTEEFDQFVQNEFRHELPRPSEVNRRDLLRLMAASFALAGLSACTKQPDEKIVPYVRAPEEFVPGKPLMFATSMPLNGFGTGVLVESHMGRPTKVEGNPEHPASLGATGIFAQASILTLYDPDRSQVVTNRGAVSNWLQFVGEMAKERADQVTRKGAGLRILTDTVTSPSFIAQMERLLAQLPGAKWIQYDPIAAARNSQAGPAQNAIYNFDAADVIVSLDSDFLGSGPGSVRYSKDFARRRRVLEGQQTMNRLYAAEPVLSITGSMADHRLPLKASQVESLARSLAQAVGAAGGNAEASGGLGGDEASKKWLAAAAGDLQEHKGRGVVVAGEWQPPAVHAVAQAINQALGNVGTTVHYAAPQHAGLSPMQSLRELVGEMNAGQVDLLIILGGNPVYDSPADLGFADAMSKVRLRVRLGLYNDETSFQCHWQIPQAHYLESWGDVRAYDGTIGIIQPLISPLYGGRTAIELIAVLAGDPDRSAHDLVREYWRSQHRQGDFDTFWRRSLHNGFIPNTGAKAGVRAVSADAKATALQAPVAAGTRDSQAAGLELVFRPDATIWDGQFTNNAWLQETPKPITKLTWDNVALLSPGTAERLGVKERDVLELKYRGRTVRAPAWISPGHADDSVTVFFGYGRSHAGKVGDGIGYNAYALWTSEEPYFGSGLEVRKTGAQVVLACTQSHHAIGKEGFGGSGRTHNRHIVRSGTFENFQKNPKFPNEEEPPPPAGLNIYPDWEYRGYAWGMSIDMNVCTGCSACVVACQAENNIPVVGKDQVVMGREMHWLRIDRYYKGEFENPETYNQPMACQHCETAPCEVVCPVAATAHSDEGLNQMVYNRCVGTRYCSNNCPYKVRRFNFLLYSDWATESLRLLHNPDVTVRSRGVMEKCTYCVQRISEAKIEAEKENRKLRDGEIVTACQQACPAEAIVFGDVNDPSSRVSKLRAQPHSYGVLTELNTRPRTTYMAPLKNPNPAFRTPAANEERHGD